jgi:hypothetical protein
VKPSIFQSFYLFDLDDFLIVASAIILGIFLLVLFTSILFKQQLIKHNQSIQKRINFYLVYRINLKLDVVYEFDPKHPREGRMIPVSHFLKNFAPPEAEKLYQWWENLLKAKMDTPWIFTTKITKRKHEKNRQIIFEVIKIDEEKQSIHLHRFGLKYLKPSPKKFASKQVIISSQQALLLVKKMPAKQGGIFSLHMIFPRSGLDEQFKYFYLSQIKEKILPYLSPSLLLIDTANDIILLSTKTLETHLYLEIAQTLYRVVSQYVEVNALESLIKFNLAIIEHKHFPNDLRVLIRKVKELNQVMVKKKLTISAFEKHQPITQTIEKNETVFVDEFYHKLRFELMYRPLIGLPEGQLEAQQVMLHSQLPTSLNTFELLNEAPLMVEYTKEFYRRYLYLIQQALQQETTLFLTPFSMVIKPHEFITEIKALPHPYNLIVFLDEFEVKDMASTLISLKTWADPLKQLGVRFALGLDDVLMNMNQDIYQFFDYFVVDYRRLMHVENDQKTAIQFKLIFQNFSRFEKPFIVLDLLSESSLEIISVKHVKIIGADWMMGFQSLPESPSKRQLNRLKNYLAKQEKFYGKTN